MRLRHPVRLHLCVIQVLVRAFESFYTRTHTHAHAHTHAHTYAHTYTHTHIRTYIHIHTHTHTHTRTHTHSHTHTYTHALSLSHTQSLPLSQTHAHAHVHTHTHTCTQTNSSTQIDTMCGFQCRQVNFSRISCYSDVTCAAGHDSAGPGNRHHTCTVSPQCGVVLLHKKWKETRILFSV